MSEASSGIPFRRAIFEGAVILVLILLIGVSWGCSSDATGPPDAPVGGGEETPLHGPENPALVGDTLTLSNITGLRGGNRATIRLTYLGHVAGAAALDTVMAANQFNEEPPAGFEYLLGRFWVEIVQLADPGIAFRMWDGHWESVSGAGVIHEQPLFGVCCLEEVLDGEGFRGRSWEGWVPFFVLPSDEGVLGTYQRLVWFKLR